MKARAPGKIVLSGAYSVLHGAPAIVSAVGRYVLADTSRPALLVTDEVGAALGAGQSAPWFDASELREGERKLGLGSSAAILLASLFALERAATPNVERDVLRVALFQRALQAHRAAQGGGSGVDVASSCFGGTLGYRLGAGAPELEPLALPAVLCVEMWTCPVSASTRELLSAVAGLNRHVPDVHAACLAAQSAASECAVVAVRDADAKAFVAALRDQHRALAELGRCAGVPIVTPALAELREAAEAEGGVLLPAGAGGGDIAIFVGSAASSARLRSALTERDHALLAADLAVAGVDSSP